MCVLDLSMVRKYVYNCNGYSKELITLMLRYEAGCVLYSQCLLPTCIGVWVCRSHCRFCLYRASPRAQVRRPGNLRSAGSAGGDDEVSCVAVGAARGAEAAVGSEGLRLRDIAGVKVEAGAP
jgi:hypothetical protein